MAPYELSVVDAAALIESKQLSPVELVESVLARIDQLEDKVGAFATVTAEDAMDAARRAEQEIASGNYRGPLHGITVGVKDLVETAGVPTTSSSRTRLDYIPDEDAAIVRRLAEAGAIMVGKTHTHEFAFGVITPTTRNPWNLDHIPGGSSGGSGAALAAGMCHIAIGTDTGGSIRIPSSVNGVVGLKATYGRVSRTGIASLSWALDHVGPMARTVADTAAMLQAVAGYDRTDPATVDVPVADYDDALGRGVQGLTIGVPTNYFTDGVDPDVDAAVRAGVERLAGLGAQIREVEIPHAAAYMPCEYAIFCSEASAYHQERLREKGGDIEPDVRVLLEAGELIYATDYIKALRVRSLLQQGWRDMFAEGIDLVAAPTLPQPPAKVGQEAFESTGEPVINAYVRTSAPGNLTGLPALSVPCGFTGSGLPVGMQLIGRPFDEPTVLAAGAAHEAAYERAGEMPRIG
ncbi:amidase [Blastococcus sp. Marseille-P5729]|uniref:amidase n=1 Tax=Blastococcus sp. Marseille-P5729 TaxID=2086582 RepID=UPI000D0F9117|nr:amidase [Blastococcus sp. Marseille-P5729]